VAPPIPAQATTFLHTVNAPQDQPLLDLGNINITGNGGIIGTLVIADHIGTIAVNGGYGIFNSIFENDTSGSIDAVRADGYGIRNTVILPGVSMGQLIATGNGQQLSTSNYSPDVRYSERVQFDPYTGYAPNFLTDINVYLGTTVTQPQNGDRTRAGVMENVNAAGARDLANVHAFQFRSIGQGLPIGTPVTNPTIFTNPFFASLFTFGNSIKSMTSTDLVDGLGVITGKINNLQFGADVNNLDLEISGKIAKLNINGNLADGSIIYAKGNNGNIGTIRVRGNVDGTIKAQRKIGTIFIGGNLSGTLDAQNIQKVQAGTLNTGTLTIDGNLQNLIANGDLGSPGQNIVVHGSIGTIKAGGNYNASTTVEGNLKLLKVGGSITSGVKIKVSGTLSSLQVGGDLQTNATIQAHVIKVKKIKGQTLGTISIV